MARLQGPPSRVLDLSPVAYQFPMDARGEDANWLNVRLTVTDERFQWTACAPAFLTWELHRLAAWCRGVASRDPAHPRVFAVTEPCLLIEDRSTSAQLCLRFVFQLEFRPPGLPFAVPQSGPTKDEANLPLAVPADAITVEFAVDREALAGFATALEHELTRFPVRGIELGG